jgi:radical SAM protein with 4Fe4S-binding SPASM domain
MTVAAAGKLRQVTLVLTERCNQRCSYCYVPTGSGRSMAPEVVRRGVDVLFDHAPRVGTAAVSFFGGEPFLATGLMREAAARAGARRRLGQRVTYSAPTNATALDDDAYGAIRDLDLELVVSLDGSGNERRFASGEPAEEAARFAARRVVGLRPRRLTARLTVTPANVAALADNVRSVAALGFPTAVYLPAYEAAWDPAAVAAWREQHERLADWLVACAQAGVTVPDLPPLRGILARLDGAPRRHCGAGVSHVAVGVEGTIYPCYRTVFDRRGAEVALGHVDGGLTRADVIAAYAALDPRRLRPADGACDSCAAAAGCTFFCPALGLWQEGDLAAVPAAACALLREQVAVARALAERLREVDARRHRGRSALAASASALAISAAACGGRPISGPQEDGPQGGVCPVWIDSGASDGLDDAVGGACPAGDAQPPQTDGGVSDGYVGGVCPVEIDAGNDDDGPGGLCPIGGLC